MSHATGRSLIYAGVWVIASLLAWTLYGFLSGLSDDGRVHQVFLGTAITTAIGLGTLTSLLLARRLPLCDESRSLVQLGANWGVAAAAGWNVAVMVGGPTSGLATGMRAHRLFETRPWIQGLLLLAAIVAGRVALEMPGATDLFIGGIWSSLSIAFVAAVGVAIFGRAKIALRLAAGVIWWGMAWVAAYWIKNEVGMPSMAGYGPNSLELVVAFGLGGAAIATNGGRLTAMICWAAGGLIASLVGVFLDVCLTAILAGPNSVLSGRPMFLDAGQVIGMGAGAIGAELLRSPRTGAAA